MSRAADLARRGVLPAAGSGACMSQSGARTCSVSNALCNSLLMMIGVIKAYPPRAV
jgi:hypothetical protein